MDIWGAGSVLFELISLYPLFPGSDEVDQLNRIHKVVGSPSSDVLTKMQLKTSYKAEFHFPPEKGVGIRHFIPHAPSCCVNFISRTLIYDYPLRITAREALKHPYFDELHLDISEEPDLVSETSSRKKYKSRRQDEFQKIEIEPNPPVKKNPQEPSSERERKPKRSNVQNHPKDKISILRPKHKKVKPTDEKRQEVDKGRRAPRRYIPAPQLPVIKASKLKNTRATTNTKSGDANQVQRVVPVKRNKRFGHVKSSGYGGAVGTKVSPYNSATSSSTTATDKSRARRGRLHPAKPTRLPPIVR